MLRPSTTIAATPARTRRAAYLGMLMLAAGGMVVFPLYPSLQEQFGLSTEALGIVAAAGFGASLLAEIVLAPQSDRGRARIMAVLGIVAMVGSLVLAGLATQTWVFVFAKAIGGLGYGLLFPAVSAVLIRLDPATAGQSLGRLSAAELGGVAAGPFLASVLVGFTSTRTILLSSAALVALALIPVLLWFRESPEHAPKGRAAEPTLAFDLLRHRRVWGAGLLTVALMVPVGAYDSLWPRFMADLGADEVLIGASYVLFALPFILLAGYAGRLGDRLGGGQAFARGLVVLVAMILLYSVLTNPFVVTGIGMVESSGQALAFVGAATAMAQAVTTRRAGAAQGLSRALGLIGATVASAFSGWAYAVGGAPLLFGGTAVIVLAISALAWVLMRGSHGTPPIGHDPDVEEAQTQPVVATG